MYSSAFMKTKHTFILTQTDTVNDAISIRLFKKCYILYENFVYLEYLELFFFYQS